MWIGPDTPIELQRNATLDFSGQVWDDVANVPVDLTGLSISCAVAIAAGETPVVLPTATIDDPTNGGFTVSFVGSDFSSVDGMKEPVRLAYDVRIGTSAVMRGTLILIPGVGA